MAKPKSKRIKPTPKRQPALRDHIYKDDEIAERFYRGLYAEDELPDWGSGPSLGSGGRDYFSFGTDD